MSCTHKLNEYGLMVVTEPATTTMGALAMSNSQSTTTTTTTVASTTNTTTTIMATSAKQQPTTTSVSSSNHLQRYQHRKGFFDHLKPRAFVTSTLRVVMQQGTLIMASLMSDQLEGDIRRNQMVEEGLITQEEADEQGEEWEKEEWEKRWKCFPEKLSTALAKYHIITIFMRAYEHLAALKFDATVMNKLTVDPFMVARKYASDNHHKHNQNYSSKSNVTTSSSSSKTSTTTTTTSTLKDTSSMTIAKEMFVTTFWGNLIAFLADYSVHQIIVCYGYYLYIKRKRQQAIENSSKKDNANNSAAVAVDGAILTSFLRKSTQLFVSRGFGLVCSAVGGSIGTLWWPGWGTLLLSNMGEGAAAVIMDDGQASSSSSSSSKSSSSNNGSSNKRA